MKERKIKEFKFGQLITINNIVYRCQNATHGLACIECDVNTDFDIGYIKREQYQKICLRCREFCKNFKRVSNGKPGRQVSNQMC